jgi:hypothetical protein
MRGSDKRSGSLFSYIDLESRVRRDHPLRAIRQLADAALESLTAAFGELYARTGRPSIPPEMLLRAMLLQAFYTIRSERTPRRTGSQVEAGDGRAIWRLSRTRRDGFWRVSPGTRRSGRCFPLLYPDEAAHIVGEIG